MSDRPNTLGERSDGKTDSTVSTDHLLRQAYWPEDTDALRELRQAVFVEEQGVAQDIEWDGKDADALHALLEIDGRPIACGRILSDGRIGRLAVRKEHRNQSYGTMVLAKLVEFARARGDAHVYLHAQAAAESFYKRSGFRREGAEFLEAEIRHVSMEMELHYKDWDSLLYPVRYPQPFSDLVVAQARLARRELRILSPRLDRAAFEQQDLYSAVRQLLKRGRMSRVQVIVQDVPSLIARGHGMLELARRLPSAVEIRALKEHPQWNGDTLIIRDRDSVLTRSSGDHAAAFYRPQDRARAKTAVSRFDDLWNASTVSPEFRSLSI
ncbi:MAG: GNAT family N-acetyltransferase [Pseudomonadota bacterium]